MWFTEKYLNELHALNFYKPNVVFDFYVETQDIVFSYRPFPILLNQDNSYWYYLTSKDCANLPRDQEDRHSKKLIQNIIEFKSLLLVPVLEQGITILQDVLHCNRDLVHRFTNFIIVNLCKAEELSWGIKPFIYLAYRMTSPCIYFL